MNTENFKSIHEAIFDRTAATIKILNVVQDLLNADQPVVFESVPQYNSNTGVVYLFIETLNITICADEFNEPCIEIHDKINDEFVEMTVKEYCVWKGL